MGGGLVAPTLTQHYCLSLQQHGENLASAFVFFRS